MSERSFPRERGRQMNVGQDGSGRSNPDLQAGTGGAPPAGWSGLKPPHGHFSSQFGHDGGLYGCSSVLLDSPRLPGQRPGYFNTVFERASPSKVVLGKQYGGKKWIVSTRSSPETKLRFHVAVTAERCCLHVQLPC